MVRIAGQVWPFASLLAAGLVVAPFYGLMRKRTMPSRDSDTEANHLLREEMDELSGRTERTISESRMPLVDNRL